MEYVRGRVTRWVEHEWPGWVEVEIVEADDNRVALVDKVPVFDDQDRLVPGVVLPMDVTVPGDVLRRERTKDGEEVVTVTLHHSIQDDAARTTFRVRAGQVITSTKQP